MLTERLASFGSAIALVDDRGPMRYEALDAASVQVAGALLNLCAPGNHGNVDDLDEARVAFLVPPGRDYVATLLGVWRAGGIAVPLAASHPPAELEYVVRDAGASVIVADAGLMDRAGAVAEATGVPLIDASALTSRAAAAQPAAAPSSTRLPALEPGRRALMLYTSGTTGRPKGVVTTHGNVRAQVTALVEAWGWSADDRTLLVLPLHHVHGIINVVCSSLWCGATCELLPGFDAGAVWARLASGELTVFTAVPTIYYKLIEAWDADAARQAERSSGAGGLRLMMSGSAALPVRTLERWRAITGQVLLERYGMTEIGMALSNPLDGTRRPGFVGGPLPGVEVRLVDEAGRDAAPGTSGEIEVRGPGVFREYWQRPDDTRAAFRDGWFRTGDVAVVEDGAWRLLGRASVDILKTGGFKVSALEIEDMIREHPLVRDCAVVGVDDPEWGQRVCAAVVGGGEAGCPAEELADWLRQRLAPYKVPREYRLMDALPRNAMGKVVKPAVATLFEGEAT